MSNSLLPEPLVFHWFGALIRTTLPGGTTCTVLIPTFADESISVSGRINQNDRKSDCSRFACHRMAICRLRKPGPIHAGCLSTQNGGPGHVNTTPMPLARQSFEQLSALKQAFILFEELGHNPAWEEAQRFNSELVRIRKLIT